MNDITLKEFFLIRDLLNGSNEDYQIAISNLNNLEFNDSKLEATVLDYCDRDDVQLQLNELLVVEY